MKITLLDFKITPCCECFIFSFGVIPRRLSFTCRRFGTLCSIFIGLVHTTSEDGTECSETSAHKIQTPGNHPKERTQNHTCLKRKGSSTQLLYVTLYMPIKTWFWVPNKKLWLIMLFPFCKPRHGPVYFLFFSSELVQRTTPNDRRSQWPRGLRSKSAYARLMRLWVRIPPGAWMSVCCECCMLSGRGLCDELITRPEESYRMWEVIVCDLKTSWMRRPWPHWGLLRKKNKQTNKQTPSEQHAGHIVPNQYNYLILRCSDTSVSTNSKKKKIEVTIRLMQFRTEDWNLNEVLIQQQM